MGIMNSFINYIFEELAWEASRLARYKKKPSIHFLLTPWKSNVRVVKVLEACLMKSSSPVSLEAWTKLEVVYEETTNEEESHEVSNLALMAIGDESVDKLDEVNDPTYDLNSGSPRNYVTVEEDPRLLR
ncbi:hypothetical protein WN943_010642 [Citrus x changshan-huyou]